MPKSPIVHLQHHQQEHSASCLAACVVMILSSWQIEVTRRRCAASSGRSLIPARIL